MTVLYGSKHQPPAAAQQEPYIKALANMLLASEDIKQKQNERTKNVAECFCT